MSPIWLALTLKMVLAINLNPKTTSGVSPEVAKLEAAVLAKYGNSAATTDPDAAPSPSAESSALGAAVLAKKAELAALEAAVLAQQSPAAAAPTPGAPATSAASEAPTSKPAPHVDLPKDVLDLEALVLAKYGQSKHIDSHATQESPASVATPAVELPKDVLDLEALVLAKYGQSKHVDSHPEEEDLLSVSPPPELPKDVLDLEALVLAKYGQSKHVDSHPEEPLQINSVGSKSEQMPAAELPKEAPIEPPAPVSPEIAKLEAAVLAKYSGGGSAEEAQKEVPGQRAKNILTKDTPAASSSAPAAPATKSKSILMKDTPADRNHGAAMQHVEPAPRKSAAAEKQEPAPELAKKRAEVEDAFHLSKKSSTPSEPKAEEFQAPAGQSTLRFVLTTVVVLTLIIVALSKHEDILRVISRMSPPTLPTAKAKQEDFDFEGGGGGFGRPNNRATSRGQWPSADGFRTSVTSVVSSGRQTLSRRTAADTSNFDYGV